MKNLFVKFLMIAAVVGSLSCCDKDEKNEGGGTPAANYFSLDGKNTEIVTVLTSTKTEENGSMLTFLFLGKGLSANNTIYGYKGKGNVMMISTLNKAGSYVEGPEAAGAFMKNFDSSAEGSSGAGNQYEELGLLQPGTKITWSVTGDVYTVDVDGTYKVVDPAGAAILPVKGHFSGTVKTMAQ